MALEIRPYTPEETDAFRRVPSIVFGNYSDPLPPIGPNNPVGIPPEWSLCAFEDGTLATTYGAFPLVFRLNGRKAQMAGVTFVGTLPQFRRRGHLRKIMETDFRRRYEQRMEPIAGLLASIAAIYQRYGYAVCSTAVRASIDPRWVRFVPSLPEAKGTWREASADELPLLDRMYRDFSGPRNGYLHRAPVIWQGQVLMRGGGGGGGGPDFGPSLLAIYEEQGEPTGYLAYGARFFDRPPYDDGGGPGQRVAVRDYLWKTPSANRAIWEFLRNFDLAARIWINAMPLDDPAPHILLDPRELYLTQRDHLLCRIIDVERAMPLRPYGAEGRIVFELRDEMCPWNNGRWALEAGRDGASVARSKESPQLSLDVSALVQMLFGQLSATHLIRHGRAEAATDAPVSMFDAMFATAYMPFCPDWF